MVKKIFLLLLLISTLIFLSVQVNALGINASPSGVTNFSNVSGTINVSITVTGAGTESYIGKYTFSYATWAYQVANGTYRQETSQNNNTFNDTFFGLFPRDTTNGEWPDGKNYSFNHTIWNYDNTTNFSLFFYNITIDNTAPTLSLATYTNATVKGNSQELTFNVSISDATVGLLNSSNAFCFINVNGTNQSIPEIGGWCNTTSLALTGMSDGNNTIRVYANDTLGNMVINSNRVVWIDETAPSASISCTATTIDEGDAFPCSCSTSDATAGINSSASGENSTSPEGTSAQTTAGTYTYSCTAVDNADNVAISTQDYIVEASDATGGGNAGSSSTPPTEKAQTHSFLRITPGTASTVVYNDADLGLKQIEIAVTSEAQNVMVTVTEYSGRPSSVSIDQEGKVYQYMQITATNLQDKLDKATVTLKVPKTWVSSNSVNKDNIIVSRFENSAWTELNTTYSSEDATYYYYETELSGFSYFVISERVIEDTNLDDIIGPPEEPVDKKISLVWLWILLGAVLLVVVVWETLRKAKKEGETEQQTPTGTSQPGANTEEPMGYSES